MRTCRSRRMPNGRAASVGDDDLNARVAGFCRRLALVWLLLPAISVASEAPLAFSTGAGDAWAFEKHVEVAIKPGACDAVAMSSPRGSITVRTNNDRAQADIPLGAGDNAVQAQCMADGAPRGEPIAQHWFVRAREV